jgi:hypothetical protein
LKERSDLAPDNYLNRWVSVHGILTSYKNRFQIALDEPFGIEMLVDESEAMHRLGKETNHREYSSKPDPTIPSVSSEPIKPVPKTPVKADLEKLRKYSDLVATRIDELYRNKK